MTDTPGRLKKAERIVKLVKSHARTTAHGRLPVRHFPGGKPERSCGPSRWAGRPLVRCEAVSDVGSGAPPPWTYRPTALAHRRESPRVV
jgi:hypothetical protein